MPRFSSSIALVLIAILFATALSSGIQPTTHSAGKMPLPFTKNTGQWDNRVLFRTSSNGAIIWITNDGITYQYLRRVATQTDPSSGHSIDPSSAHSADPSSGHSIAPFSGHSREGDC